MSENSNDRWRHHLPFEVAPPQKPQGATEADRSWMPTPSVGADGGIDWWRDRGVERAWHRPRDWAAQQAPAFFAQLEAAEQTLLGLERTVQPYDPRLQPARERVARYYGELNRIHDQHLKKQR